MTPGYDAGPLLLSISEIARMKGVSQPAITKRVMRFEEQGLLSTVPGKGRQRLVPIAEYDRLVGETTDFSRVRGPVKAVETAVQEPNDSAKYSAEQARLTRYRADREELALARQLGEVLLTADVEKAMALCAEAMVRKIDQMPGLADELAAAVGRGGADAARVQLKEIARGIRQTLADSMKLLADTASGAGAEDSEDDA